METSYQRALGTTESAMMPLRGIGGTAREEGVNSVGVGAIGVSGGSRGMLGGAVSPSMQAHEGDEMQAEGVGPPVYHINSGMGVGNVLGHECHGGHPDPATRRPRLVPPPIFSGTQPRHWVSMATRYYDILGFSDEERIQDAVSRLDGEALNYWCSVEHGDPRALPVDWDEFKQFMIDQFCGQTVGTTIRRLQGIIYRGDIEQVAKEFAKVLAEGQSPPPEVVRDLFISRFPYKMVKNIIAEDLPSWIQVREALRTRVGREEEGAFRWYAMTSEALRREAANDPEYRRDGWIPASRDQDTRGYSRPHVGEEREMGRERRSRDRERGFMAERMHIGQNPKPRQEADRCHTCRGEGHKAKDCPNGNAASRRDGQRCRGCGGVGHWASACPSQLSSRYKPGSGFKPKEFKSDPSQQTRQGNGRA